MSAAAAKPAPAHPPYVTMIAAAIKSLKERTGSSSKAIGKYIGASYKVPAGFEKTLGQQLKRLAAAGKLVRVKASFKLSDELKKEPKKKVAKKPAAKKAVKKPAAKKPKAAKPAAKAAKPAAKAPKAAKPAAKAPKAAKPATKAAKPAAKAAKPAAKAKAPKA